MRGAVIVCVAAAALLVAACSGSTPVLLDQAALKDPSTCKNCHPNHYDEWSGSMHAYAADDPVFLAMNQRAQRESNGALGNFCIKCHAPVAVQEAGATATIDLSSVPQWQKGVTCYFCHAAESVAGTHNNPLTLSKDGTLFGPFDDPVVGTPHRSKKTDLFDDTNSASAAACGACHDIVNLQGAHVERTYEEWQGTLFANPMYGLTCAVCHMNPTMGPASTISTNVRSLHSHEFAGVDLALTPFPRAEVQRALTQKMQDASVQSALCFNPATRRIEVVVDNVGAGHGWPSGATPDRRAWVEVTAFAAGQQIYSSGGAAATPLEDSPDPDLWLIRDCLFDAQQKEQRMFWQATSVSHNQLPGSLTLNVNDPNSFATHMAWTYPTGAGAQLAQTPDRITLKVHIQAIGDDVLQDLVATKDLDPSIPPLVAKFELAGAAVEWTPATARTMNDPQTGLPKTCVRTGPPPPVTAVPTPAKSQARCEP
jgi:hypothetical protein